MPLNQNELVVLVQKNLINHYKGFNWRPPSGLVGWIEGQ